jgi:hypothetical protein
MSPTTLPNTAQAGIIFARFEGLKKLGSPMLIIEFTALFLFILVLGYLVPAGK